MVRWMMDVISHGELPWGEQSLTSEKPILHYITHTESSRKHAHFERVRTEHVRNGEIPASYPEIARSWHSARYGGRHHPFPNFPPVPLLRSGESQPRKVAPG